MITAIFSRNTPGLPHSESILIKPVVRIHDRKAAPNWPKQKQKTKIDFKEIFKKELLNAASKFRI